MARRRQSDSFNLSFLDIMSCGFGAIILLLMITKSSPPTALEDSVVQDEGLVQELQQQLFAIRGETTILNRELTAKREQRSDITERVARLARDRQNLSDQTRLLAQESSSISDELGQLQVARQRLTAEMRRLQEEQDKVQALAAVGGVPVDSEYIIFVIDTSGSMFNSTWGKTLAIIEETLDVYPQVKGIQVMNDMGEYLFRSYQGDWIPDTPARRNAIIQRLRNWGVFSNSSPVEGIERAIRTYARNTEKVSIYVLGDAFTGNSISDVVRTVDRINTAGPDGERMVRIHGIGFPVHFLTGMRYGGPPPGIRFATLMRELARKNGGTFVGLREIY